MIPGIAPSTGFMAMSRSATTDADVTPALEARFHALVLPHLDRMLGFAKRRVASAGDAEDAVQEACIRAWMSFPELRDDTRTRAWLYRILRGVLSDIGEKALRRAGLVSMTRLDDVHERMLSNDDEGLFAEVVARIDSEQLHAALARIPQDFAVAIELHDIDGFKYHEIADIVGVPLGTVMSRISRGRRLLAASILAHRKAWALGTPDTRPARYGTRGPS
jgi:RNA polymerase sigma-70 factor (ECF subfamily)